MTTKVGFSTANLRDVAAVLNALDHTDLGIERVVIEFEDGDRIVASVDPDDDKYIVTEFLVVSEVE